MDVREKMVYKMKELCQALGVPAYRVAYIYDSKLLPEPQRMGPWRVFTEKDVIMIRALLESLEKAGMGRPRTKSINKNNNEEVGE